jgi:hypothetical protein
MHSTLSKQQQNRVKRAKGVGMGSWVGIIEPTQLLACYERYARRLLRDILWKNQIILTLWRCCQLSCRVWKAWINHSVEWESWDCCHLRSKSVKPCFMGCIDQILVPA